MKHTRAKRILTFFLMSTIGCSPDADRRTASQTNDAATATNSASNGQAIYDMCGKGNLKAVSKLLECNPELVNSQEEDQKETPLMHSVDHRQDKVTEYLIRKGANVNLKSKYGETALHLAAFRRDVTAVRLLLDAGAEVNARLRIPSKETPLDYAVSGGEKLALERTRPPESIWHYVPKTSEQLRAEDEELKQVLELLKAHGARRAFELANEKHN